MSYSRWSYSNWYSFYNSSSDDNTKDEQVLSLWHCQFRDFTYKELLDIGEKKLKSLYPEADDADIIEALEIIELFKTDVTLQFGE